MAAGKKRRATGALKEKELDPLDRAIPLPCREPRKETTTRECQALSRVQARLCQVLPLRLQDPRYHSRLLLRRKQWGGWQTSRSTEAVKTVYPPAMEILAAVPVLGLELERAMAAPILWRRITPT